MSLADQLWCPTSVQVTVLQARGLKIKGKGGTNDAFAVMQVGKEKYQTTVAEKSVAPVWKEEATFDLPQLQQQPGGGGGAERSTLHVHVHHRALVGPDKLLGQAVINLPQLSQDKTRSKTEWFKLLDKTGKADKDRGEVLVDIQFLRNNMTASMFDLSAAGRSKSRLGKFKDKVRGKKKDSGASFTAAPSFTQVLTDSEDEEGNGDGEEAAGKDEKKKKKKKIKSLFSPKTNLQKNMSQSMSVLPAKNSLSGSQSSGLNVDASEGKKKFKFMIHKRSGSSGAKDFSSAQQKAAEQSNLCINGSHVYYDEPQNRTSRIGSNFSPASSGHGSMEDVPDSSPPSVDSLRTTRQYSPWTEEEISESLKEGEEEEETQIEEEKVYVEEGVEKENARKKEEKILKEEEMRQEEEKRRLEEKQRWHEEKVRKEEEMIRMEGERKKEQRLEEEKRWEEEKTRENEERRKDMERKRLEEERRRLEEERRRLEEEEEEKRLEEERRMLEERRRMEEEEEKRLEEEMRRLEKEEEKRLEEERRRLEEEEEEKSLEEERRMLEEEERRRLEKEEEEEKRLEEERRLEEEEEKRLEEERRRLEEEERRRLEEEERRRLEEEEKRLEEERRRLEEEKERRRLEEEERRRLEEEEEERRLEQKARKEEEKRKEMERVEEEVRKEERRMEEEKRKQEEQRNIEERFKEEMERHEQEKRRQDLDKEKEEKARRDMEGYARMMKEMKEQEEEEREQMIIEQRKEKEDQRIWKEEEDRARKEEEERSLAENKEEVEKKAENFPSEEQMKNVTQIKSDMIASLNPFDENYRPPAGSRTSPPAGSRTSPPAGSRTSPPAGSRTSPPAGSRTSPPAASLLRPRTSSSDDKDQGGSQREKRPAPQPPGKHQAPRGPQGSPPRADRRSTDIGTAPQKSFRATSPVGRSDPQNTSMHSSSVKVTLMGAKQGKGPAPSRPCPGARAPPTSNISHTSSLDVKQAPISYGLNPFEDDEDEDEANFDPTRWPPAAASSSKFKSSKKARAPPLPELCDTPSTSVGLNPGGDPDPAVVVPDNHEVLPSHPGGISEAKPVTPQGSGGKREEPPTTKRRLLPVKPLNPLRQAVNQGGKDIQAFGILSDDLKNTKGDLELKGPYSQLTKAELISLVLKQDNQLLEKDKKVSELERYIDNLLVRVMEEQPSILMSMNTLKKSV